MQGKVLEGKVLEGKVLEGEGEGEGRRRVLELKPCGEAGTDPRGRVPWAGDAQPCPRRCEHHAPAPA